MNNRNTNSTVYSCKKVPFKNKLKADEALEKINGNPRSEERKMTGTYKCLICGKWHLTSMTRERHIAIVSCKKVRENTLNPSANFIQNRMEFLMSKNKMKR